jgi:hypothetical protein
MENQDESISPMANYVAYSMNNIEEPEKNLFHNKKEKKTGISKSVDIRPTVRQPGS